MRPKFIYLIAALFLICSCSKEEEQLYGGSILKYDDSVYVVEDGEVHKKHDYTITLPYMGGIMETVFFVEDKNDSLRAAFIQESGYEWLGNEYFIPRYESYDRQTLIYADDSGKKTEVTGFLFPVSVYAAANYGKKDRSVVCYYQVGERNLKDLIPTEMMHKVTVVQKWNEGNRPYSLPFVNP